MTDEALAEVAAQLTHLIGMATDHRTPVLSRIGTAANCAPYLETLTRLLVGEARDKGHTWEQLADVFVTTPMGVKSRFDTYRKYPGEIEDDDDEG